MRIVPVEGRRGRCAYKGTQKCACNAGDESSIHEILTGSESRTGNVRAKRSRAREDQMRRMEKRASLSTTPRGGDVSLNVCATVGARRGTGGTVASAGANATVGAADDPVSFAVGVS